VNTPKVSPNIRTGRFLWMDEKSRNNYLSVLSKKISEGYFSSEMILTKVVDEIAPVFDDSIRFDA
jgi:hypothetical protein